MVKKSSQVSGWQRVEALRERAELKASLADIWDDDFDLDDEILADLEHDQAFFTPSEEAVEESIELDGDEDDFLLETDDD